MMSATAVGTMFENMVAAELRRLGFEVWQDCYAPTEQGFTQIDIIALRPGQLWTVECKNWSGTLDAFNWTWCHGGKVEKVNDFTKQGNWHGIVIHDHVHIPCLSRVVVNDGLSFKEGYFPTAVCHLSQLAATAASITYDGHYKQREVMDARAKFLQWTATDEETKKQHRLRLQDKYNPPEVVPL